FVIASTPNSSARPSHKPTPIATTFFMMAPTSTPTTSFDVYVRKCCEPNSSATVLAESGLEDAQTTAVGTPAAISLAIDGPAIATTRRVSPSSSATTPVAGISDSSSQPFVAIAQMQSPVACD